MRTKRGIRGKGKEKPREGGRHVREKVGGRGARRGEQGEKKGRGERGDENERRRKREMKERRKPRKKRRQQVKKDGESLSFHSLLTRQTEKKMGISVEKQS